MSSLLKNPAKQTPNQNSLVSDVINKLRKRRPFKRYVAKTDPKPAQIIAYDFETTRIEAGTPIPLYITIYSEAHGIEYASRITSPADLRSIIKSQFLRDDLTGVKYVGWNANNFDAYFIASILVQDDEYIIRPYLTKNNQLRGLRVIPTADIDLDTVDQRSWEFLDGMAMLGMAGISLAKFLKTFAPEHEKLTGIINWETETFDYKNPKHCEYAMRDSVGLYHGMVKCQNILIEQFGQPLTVTMGNACIKIFQKHIPEDVTIKSLDDKYAEIIRLYLVRGGFCFCVRQYHGPVWKYDINQAYAAAMRETQLPCGNLVHTKQGLNIASRIYVARVTCENKNNKIPFYAKIDMGGRIRAMYCEHLITDTWLTSSEIAQLKTEGWKITIHESLAWEDSFTMREYIDRLEHTRMNCDGGPKGPIGTMVKAVGNHSYGKTLEETDDTELLMSKEQPDGYEPYYGNDLGDHLMHTWQRRTGEDTYKPYHQPQIAVFITAHVRMVVRRAALVNPDTWLYADTDCVMYASDETANLNIHESRYGAWKIEDENAEYRLIAKKVYQDVKTGIGHAKGLNVKKLQPNDYALWLAGTIPVQKQVQRQNFVAVMQGAEMYIDRTRSGTDVDRKNQSRKKARTPKIV